MEALHLAEIQKPVFTKATLVKITLPGATIRLTDGGFVTFAAESYVARDPTYGVLGSIGSITDGESQAQRVEITLQPPSDVAVAALASPLAQGSLIQWWEGSVNPATGLIVGTPELKFQGELDFARFSVGESWALVLVCGTPAERLLEQNDERRLVSTYHKAIWPGELGLDFVSDNPIRINWRNGASNAISYGGGGGGVNGPGGNVVQQVV